MKFVILFLISLPLGLFAQSPVALHPNDVPPVVVSPGVILKELIGRTAPGSAKSDRNSVALFHLDPGCASAWSYNKIG